MTGFLSVLFVDGFQELSGGKNPLPVCVWEKWVQSWFRNILLRNRESTLLFLPGNPMNRGAQVSYSLGLQKSQTQLNK